MTLCVLVADGTRLLGVVRACSVQKCSLRGGPLPRYFHWLVVTVVRFGSGSVGLRLGELLGRSGSVRVTE